MSVAPGVTVNDWSENSIVINGNINLGAGAVLNVGDTSRTGNMTVVGGQITGTGSLNVVRGTVSLRNSDIDLTNGAATGGNLTVSANGAIRQTGSSVAMNVRAENITVTNGTVDIRGDLVADTTLTITGNDATVRADEVNALPGGTLIIDDDSTVTAEIAQGVTGSRNPVTGDVTYGGNYDETVNDPDTGANWLDTVSIGTAATVDVSNALTASVTLPNGTYANTSVSVDFRTGLTADDYTVTYYHNNAVANNGTMTLTAGANTVTIDVIEKATGSRQSYTINVTVASAADTHTLTVTEGEGIASVTVSGNGVTETRGTYSFVPGTQITIEVTANEAYRLGADAVTYTVTGQQGTNTLTGANGTYILNTTGITGNVAMTAKGTYMAKTPTVTEVTVADDYSVDNDTAVVVAEVEATNATGATILVSKLPESEENAQDYLTAALANTTGTWGSLPGRVVSKSETTYVVELTLPAAGEGDNDGTFTLTFRLPTEAEASEKDLVLVQEVLTGADLQAEGTTNAQLKAALQAALEGAAKWGSDVEVETCTLQSGSEPALTLSYSINVGTENITGSQVFNVSVN